MLLIPLGWTHVQSLYYQNDSESIHAFETCLSDYKAQENFQRLSDSDDKEQALYGARSYIISTSYQDV